MNDYHLTEEIARWAFEVLCREGELWHIAFTNPTAGPWKTIKATNKEGIVGEVYRFTLEENRPDIVLINDNAKLVLIIEAKDSLNKLVAHTQDTKSTEVVDSLAKMFKSLKHNEYWGPRYNYTIVNGLLWGSEGGESIEDISTIMDKYHDDAAHCKHFYTDMLIGIESNKEQSGDIKCKMFVKYYVEECPIRIEEVAEHIDYAIIEF